MKLLDGRKISSQIKAEIAEEVKNLVDNGHQAPHLVAILVGDNPASQSYVKNKVKSCDEVGFRSSLIKKDADLSEAALLKIVEELNSDDSVDGFIVQLPLPSHIDEHKITLAINPDKDVDGFHPINIGKMAQGLDSFLPATPYGIIQMLERSDIKTSGKRCVVVGRSNIVGTPMSILLSRKAPAGNATVTLTHSRTQNIAEEIKRADIVIAAIGIPFFVTADMVKEGAVVIDVGINRIEDSSRKRGYRLVGDVDFETVAPKTSYITPVPGGVGPLTVVSLLKNTLKSAKTRI